jgi:hypothetical protein
MPLHRSPQSWRMEIWRWTEEEKRPTVKWVESTWISRLESTRVGGFKR